MSFSHHWPPGRASCSCVRRGQSTNTSSTWTLVGITRQSLETRCCWKTVWMMKRFLFWLVDYRVLILCLINLTTTLRQHLNSDQMWLRHITCCTKRLFFFPPKCRADIPLPSVLCKLPQAWWPGYIKETSPCLCCGRPRHRLLSGHQLCCWHDPYARKWLLTHHTHTHKGVSHIKAHRLPICQLSQVIHVVLSSFSTLHCNSSCNTDNWEEPGRHVPWYEVNWSYL